MNTATFLQPHERPGLVLLCPETVSDCCNADICPLDRYRLEDDAVRLVETIPAACRKCRRVL